MSNFACACGVTGAEANTGLQPNAITFNFTDAYIVMQQVAADGTDNQIQASDLVNGVLPESFLLEKFYNSDPTKRWYLLPKNNEVTDERADPITEQIGNSNNRIVDLGNRTVTAMFFKPQESYLRNLEKLECKDLAFYMVDNCGTIGGEWLEGSTTLKPIKIGKDTFYARPMPGTQSSKAKIQVQFEFDRTFADGAFDILPNSAIADGQEWLRRTAKSLINVNVTISSITATGFTATLTSEASNFNQSIPIVAWSSSDFALATASATITITSVTETEAGVSGVYDFVIPDSSGETVTLSGAITDDKFVKAPYQLVATTFEIP